MNGWIEYLNRCGENFLSFAWPMLWQSSVLIVAVFALDCVPAHKIRPAVRPALWMVVLVKLLLPPALALPTGATWWLWPTKASLTPIIKSQVVTYDTAPLPRIGSLKVRPFYSRARSCGGWPYNSSFQHSEYLGYILGREMETPKPDSAQEAEIARLRGDLLTVASRVSHDLRTPLGGIVTTAEVIQEILAEKNEPTTLPKAILDSVDDMTRLIKQISFITRATGNPQPKKPLPMGPIVGMALQRVEKKIRKTGAVVIQPDAWPQVNGVADWLEEIWWNFLANVLQHVPETPRAELAWRQDDGFYRFEISDNGPGVPEHIRPGLFHPFNMLHVPGSAKGLGLSIVQRLVDMQGGKCGYEPLPAGSRFFFLLPV